MNERGPANSPERWREVSRIYGAVLTRPESDRPAVLADLCADDHELRREVESLLASGTGAALLDRAAADRPSVMAMANGVTIGSRIGVFEIQSLLGVGGMGEVYRARDTKLNRDVAIKILPAAFASDPDRLARFKREAQVLAALNHPNIAGIYGLEDAPAEAGAHVRPDVGSGFSRTVHAIVMELVDGPTLADRIAKGALPLDEALAIARQIAEALETAHEQGIIHRDLKPANIKVRDDGTVKVLDFGLAKMAEPDDSRRVRLQPDLTASPTITTPAMTAAGMILGTAAYMSPEQAKGKPADSRSDIWAFGCVLYEMLTGTRPFNGEDVADTLAAVLRGDPDWTHLPLGTPASILRLLHRSLEKDRKRRLPHIGVARSEIDDAGNAAPAVVPAASHADGRGRERLLWAAGLVLVAALAALGAFVTRPSSARPAETRLDIATPPTSDPASIAISPDGRRLVFVAEVENQPRLWIRDLGTGAVKALARTEGASYPFWSPDNRSVAFFTASGQLMRIDLDGETVRPIARAGLGRGGAWGPDGTILYAENALQVIKKVGAEGGVPASVTTFREGDASHSFPRFLPDGKHFLFFIAGAPNDTGIFVADLDGTAPRRLVDADAAGIYAAGHLFYVKQGRLFAQMMDPSRNTLSGAPAPVADQVAVVGGASNLPALSISTDGTIVYRSGEARNIRQLEWVDRAGAVVASIDEPDRFFPTNPALSHDDRWLAVTRIQGGNGDIWTFDLANGAKRTRFTTDPRAETYPMWSPDGQRLVFTRNSNLVMVDMSTRSEETLLNVSRLSLRTGSTLIANDWSAVDGGTLIVRSSSQVGNDQYAAVTGYDLYALSVATRRLTPVATTNANEREGQFSPDGKWIAFQSDASGRYEIYLQRFPEGTDNVVVSRNGGAQVRWNSNGKELFYVDLSGQLMAAPISTQGGRAEPGTPKALFSTHVGGLMAVFRAQYVVSRDGQRFLMNSVVNTVNTTPISVVLNWAGLNRADATRAQE